MLPIAVLLITAVGLHAGASDHECCPCGLADWRAAAILLAAEAEEGARSIGLPAAPPATCVDAGALVDVLVVYTPAALVDLGSVEELAAQVSLSVALANVTLERSLLETRFRLVGLEPVEYVESGNMAIDMLRLSKPADGFMDSVHPLRDALGADLVSLRVGSGQYCGIAYIAKSPPDPTKGFSVLQCDGAVPAHEWGHSLGACHASGDDDGVGVCDVLGGAFPFSHGWRFDGPDGQTYRTMMAYLPGSKILVYSNPDVHWLGVPTGHPTEGDNAQTISLMASGVSAFRPATFVDCDGDGLDDACAILDGAVADCNGNWVPDACDIATSRSADIDCDGAPDECSTLVIDGPLPISGLAPGDGAGSAVALCDDMLAVGVPGADSAGEDAGAVVVFQRTQRGWTATANLHAPSPMAHHRFGAALAMHADGNGSGVLLLVGRPSTDGAAGGAELFHHADGRWQHQATLEAPSTEDVGFGAVVALDGTTLAIGAPKAVVEGIAGAGAVHAYQHEKGRVNAKGQRLVAPPPAEADEFGAAIAFVDGALAIGAPLDDVPDLSAGSAFIFERSGHRDAADPWTLAHTLTSPGGEAFGLFGSAIAGCGQRLAITSPEEQIAPAGDGTVHLFERAGRAFVPVKTLVPTGAPAVEQSGAPCAMNDSLVVAGMPRDASVGSASGAVVAHRAVGAQWLPITLRAADAAESAMFGASVAVAGSTLAIGAPGHDGVGAGDVGMMDSGAVYLVELAPHPDTNGDGVADSCLGTPDLNGDGTIDGDDLSLLLGSWGPCDGCSADLDGDGAVDGADLGTLLAHWG